jgi:undecaprenyl-diphosphatase
MSGWIDFPHRLKEIDEGLFDHVNNVWTHWTLDRVFPILTDLHTNKYFLTYGLPVIILALCYQYRWLAVRFILALGLTIFASDSFNHKVVKPYFDRDRPQFTEGIKATIRTESHSGRSFPSNHAVNTFAAAVILSYYFPLYFVYFYLFATLIAYSRVYVGVHFPSDVFVGGILGFLIAKALLLIWREIEDRIQANKRSKVYEDAGGTRENLFNRK